MTWGIWDEPFQLKYVYTCTPGPYLHVHVHYTSVKTTTKTTTNKLDKNLKERLTTSLDNLPHSSPTRLIGHTHTPSTVLQVPPFLHGGSHSLGGSSMSSAHVCIDRSRHTCTSTHNDACTCVYTCTYCMRHAPEASHTHAHTHAHMLHVHTHHLSINCIHPGCHMGGVVQGEYTRTHTQNVAVLCWGENKCLIYPHMAVALAHCHLM
jgi:hypothetical protein